MDTTLVTSNKDRQQIKSWMTLRNVFRNVEKHETFLYVSKECVEPNAAQLLPSDRKYWTSPESERHGLWIHSGLRCQRAMLSVQSVIQWNWTPPPLVQRGPWHPARPACLNIRSHPEAWDSSPPEAVNPDWAAALYFTESAYRVPRGVYSHKSSVSFEARHSCFFCLRFWHVEL